MNRNDQFLGDFMSDYSGKLKTQLFWWLSKSRPFYVNDEYKIELLFIDKNFMSAKILITNLKTGEQSEALPGSTQKEESFSSLI